MVFCFSSPNRVGCLGCGTFPLNRGTVLANHSWLCRTERFPGTWTKTGKVPSKPAELVALLTTHSAPLSKWAVCSFYWTRVRFLATLFQEVSQILPPLWFGPWGEGICKQEQILLGIGHAAFRKLKQKVLHKQSLHSFTTSQTEEGAHWEAPEIVFIFLLMSLGFSQGTKVSLIKVPLQTIPEWQLPCL